MKDFQIELVGRNLEKIKNEENLKKEKDTNETFENQNVNYFFESQALIYKNEPYDYLDEYSPTYDESFFVNNIQSQSSEINEGCLTRNKISR